MRTKYVVKQVFRSTSFLQSSFLHKESAEMASLPDLFQLRSFKKPLSFGHFKWSDEMLKHQELPMQGKKICSSKLEIVENGDIAHALNFYLTTQVINKKPYFIIIFIYIEGRFEEDIFLDFKLSLSKQDKKGDFSDVFRNFEASRDGIVIDKSRRRQSFPIGPISQDKAIYCHFPYVQSVHKICDADYERNAKVEVELFVSLDYAKPKLTDTTESTLEKSMQKLFLNDDELSDMKIVCDGKEFPTHKLILSARSDVFKAMFTSNLKINEETESFLQIPDVSAETMETFLKFIYKDVVNVEDIDQNLLIAADKYNIKRLVNICIKHFENTIDTKNVMEITFVAYLINNDTLLEKASKFMIENHGKIKKPEQWDQIKKTHPHIATKVMDLIIFDEQPSSQG